MGRAPLLQARMGGQASILSTILLVLRCNLHPSAYHTKFNVAVRYEIQLFLKAGIPRTWIMHTGPFGLFRPFGL